MTLPTGYDPKGLVPIIVITDRTDTEQYRFEHSLAVSGTANQDIPVTGYHLHGGIGAELGRLNINIDDRNNSLLDTTKRNRPSKIKPQWFVEVWHFVAGDGSNPAAGVSLSTLRTTHSANKWFKGLIMEPDLARPLNNMQTLNVFAAGIGIRAADRLTKIKRNQDRAANGLDFDDTDTKTRVDNLAKDILEETDHYPHTGLTTESELNTTEIDSFNVKLADFQKHYNSWHNALQELANRSGQVWGIRPENGNVFMFPRAIKDSGILITNNLSSLLTTGWNKSKLCLMRNRPTGWVDSTSGYGYPFLHGVGGITDFLMVEKTSANASLDLSTDAQFAFPFTPTEDSISKISVFADLSSTTTTPLVMSIMGDDTTGTSEPSDDLRRRIQVQPDLLNDKISVAGNWFEQAFQTINMGTRVQPENIYYLVIDNHPDIRIDYQTGGGTFARNSGTIESPNWGNDTGELKMRAHHSHAIDVILENTVSKKSFGVREMPIPLTEFPNESAAVEGLIGLSKVIGKTNRIYKPVQVVPPSTIPKLGKTARLVDKFNGLDTFVELIGYDIQATSFSQWNRGINLMTLHLQEVFYPQ